MKLQRIALAAAIVASAPAYSAIVAGNQPGYGTGTGDSEMFFVAYDATAKVSYALDLGVYQSSFRAIADGNEAGYSRSWTFGSASSLDGTYFNQFISKTTQANWRWTVQGYDDIGTSAANAKSLSTTLTNGQGITDTVGASIGATSNLNFSNALGSYDNFVGNTNPLGSQAPFDSYASNGANINDPAAPASYVLTGQNMGNNGNTLFGFTTDNGFGDSSRYVYVTRSSTSNLPSALVLTKQFGNSANSGLFSFTSGTNAGDYKLTYSLASAAPPPVGAVPEPQTYVLMAAGLGALMLMRRRTRG